MPFSEFIRVAKRNVDATHQIHRGDNDSFELAWQNGHIMKHDRYSRIRKGPIPNDLSTFISKPQAGKDPNNSKMSKFSAMDSMMNDFPLCAPSCEIGLDQDEDMVPWLNFPVIEPFNNEFCSELLPDVGVAGNQLPAGNDLASMERRSHSNHVAEFACSNSAAKALNIQQENTSNVLSSTEPNKHGISETSPLMQTETLPRPGNSEITLSDAGSAKYLDVRNSARCSPMDGSMGTKLHKLAIGQPNNSSGLMNFSYFSRFASLSGVNVQNTAKTTAVVSSMQRVGDKNKGSTRNGHKLTEPALVNCPHQESSSHVKLSVPPSTAGRESVTPRPGCLLPQQSEVVCVEDGKNDKSLDQPFGAIPAKVVVGDERTPEPAAATSSVCSGNNSLERASNDPACSLKRKSHETGDSEGPSDEAEEESVGVTKTTPDRTASKRSRAAVVHNLSERRRRDRINEKMRALQELLPHCTKADKASMLDEAIEYLKTLQLQVQILSMGTGMYMPSMMLPATLQQMHRAHMPQLLPMGIGMNMGMGFGMGMHDFSYSTTQMPNIQVPFCPVPGPSISTSSMFNGAAGCSPQHLGNPGQE